MLRERGNGFSTVRFMRSARGHASASASLIVSGTARVRGGLKDRRIRLFPSQAGLKILVSNRRRFAGAAFHRLRQLGRRSAK